MSAVMFSGRAALARQQIERRPWPTLGVGVLTLVLLGTLAAALAAQPLPGLKLLGTMLYMALFSLSVLGGGGVGSLIAQKMLPLDPTLTPFQGLTRGAGILVLAGLFPVLGWFLLGPLVLIVSTGAGVLSLVTKPLSPPIPNEEF